jgi:glucose/arabinose dehydrogenase
MKTTNQVKIIICLIILESLMAILLSGCGTAQAAADTSGAPSSTAASKLSASPTPSRTGSIPAVATPTVKSSTVATTPARIVPKLTDISFTLALDTQQAFTENTTPIYLQAAQVLHLSWVVIKGGDHFFMTFTLPNGRLIAIRGNGSLGNYSTGEALEKLYKGGDVVFKPSDNDWREGYYLFHPQIFQGDPPVTVKLLYWIE